MHKVRLFITENYLFVLSGHKGDFKLLAQQELKNLDQITMISSNSSILAVNFFHDDSKVSLDSSKSTGKSAEKQIYDFLFDTIRRTELIYYLINNTKRSLRKPTFVIEKGFNIKQQMNQSDSKSKIKTIDFNDDCSPWKNTNSSQA